MNEPAQQLRLAEALLFAAGEPLSEEALARRLGSDTDIAELLSRLAEAYAERGVNLVRLSGGWTFRTAPDLAPHLRIERPVARKLSRAAVETLAIIAYHQPVTRAEIEEIRGVALGKGTLDSLMEAGWVRPKGRRMTPGTAADLGHDQRFSDPFRARHFGRSASDRRVARRRSPRPDPAGPRRRSASLGSASFCRTCGPALGSGRGETEAAVAVAPDLVDELNFPGEVFAHKALAVGGAVAGR